MVALAIFAEYENGGKPDDDQPPQVTGDHSALARSFHKLCWQVGFSLA
jgi:hypothetical protein